MNLTPRQREILALCGAIIRFSRPAGFQQIHVLMVLLARLQQELEHEEVGGYRDGVGGTGGRGLARYKRHGEEAMGKLIVRLLPERVNRALWGALRDRYVQPAPNDYVVWTDDRDDGTNDVPYAFTN